MHCPYLLIVIKIKLASYYISIKIIYQLFRCNFISKTLIVYLYNELIGGFHIWQIHMNPMSTLSEIDYAFFASKTNKLANLAGISQSYVRDIELGNKNPTIEVLFQLCQALGISLKDFFDDESLNLTNDPLIQRIYQLNASQKESLLAFLNTI